VFVMHELDQMGSQEICKVLAISASNYWVRLHRARLKLRECLELNWFQGQGA
jgi:RNA polymerase sigma-70 factor (ECF subfamily)